MRDELRDLQGISAREEFLSWLPFGRTELAKNPHELSIAPLPEA